MTGASFFEQPQSSAQKNTEQIITAIRIDKYLQDLRTKLIETCHRYIRNRHQSLSGTFPSNLFCIFAPSHLCVNFIYVIKLLHITKTVRSGTDDLTILDDVSFEIRDGEFVAVTGASGSGKSTLLGMIAGLDAPTSGSIVIDTDEITKMSEDGLARIRSEKIGFVFQSFHLIPSLTAFENILIPMEILGLHDVNSRATQLLEKVGLKNRGHHYPAELSGGEQQRVAIARAFANSPKILLADEPTGNLDSKNGQHIFELMKDLHRQNNVTLILVTHDSLLAEQAQRQIVLADGQIIRDDLNHRGSETQR